MRDENENTTNQTTSNPVPAVFAIVGIVVAQIVFERFARKYRVLRMFKRAMRVGAMLSMLASLAAGAGVRTFRLGNLLYIAGRWIPLSQIIGVYGPNWPHPMRPEHATGVALRNGRWVPLDIDAVILREKLDANGVETVASKADTSEY
jgi:hypothetical protein